MVAELYDALIDAGATDDKARTAAKAIADYESRFNNIEATKMIHTTLLTVIIGGLAALVIDTFFKVPDRGSVNPTPLGG
jgi:hypothetical protein